MEAYIVDYIRSPFGRYGGALASVRPDDLGAHVIKALMQRNVSLGREDIEDVIFGCANQAGEDNRNVARMSALLSGLSVVVPGTTVNRLCGSGLEAVAIAARQIKAGEADVLIAGGTESMTRAPFAMPKADAAFPRTQEIFDTTIGWRFVNPKMKEKYGIESMPETAECVADEYNVSREDQDAFALRSQQRADAAHKAGRFRQEISALEIPQKKGAPLVADHDEQMRPSTTLDGLTKLPTPFKKNGTVTAGNASSINDGAAALLIVSEKSLKKYNLKPIARVLGAATAGVPPRVMGIGPAPASLKLMDRLNLKISDFDVIELNEAFASQALAVLRSLKLADNAEHVNPNGGAIALGHPLGASGARLVGTAALELTLRQQKRALATMCIGVGQGIALALERA
ncbi:MAG: 3-oxoadipyl-CoA thiolase [Pseudomonadota bacterium]